MKPRPVTSFVQRPPRLPIVVQVTTKPRLGDCWSVNLSATGMGLVAHVPATERGLAEGEPIEVRFALPDSGSPIQARGIVAWGHEESRGPLRAVSLGVRFVGLAGGDRLALAQYLDRYRFHVAVVGAASERRRLLDDTLASSTALHYAASAAELESLVVRGDLAAVVAVATTERDLEEALAPLWAPSAAATTAGLTDLAPRVIVWGLGSPAALVPLFNECRLYRALPSEVDPAEIGRAVLDACRDWGLRTEQHRSALALERALARERARAQPDTRPSASVAENVVHQSRAMSEVLEHLRTVARHRLTVLLQGETGVGKEVLARTLHELSDRSAAPFVIQDCGTLTETLLESELFGHVRGAFTGATSDHVGLFVLADGGTIFLDEIENTTPALQAKLLRVLETGQVRPVGSTEVKRVDVRVIAASNRDLEAEVASGHLRRDLYYRLAAFPVRVPPLRERREDILALAQHFLTLACRDLGRPPCSLSAETAEALCAYDWPGNARELRNAIERALVLTPIGSSVVELASLPPAVVRSASASGLSARNGHRGGSLRAQLQAVERMLIAEALARNGGVVRRAARELGENAVTLARRARRLGLNLTG